MSASAAFLETDRMYFREFRDADAQLLFELDSDPEVMRFISKGKPTSLTTIQNEYIPKFLDYYRHSPPQGFWAAHLREGGSFIGWFHLRPDKISAGETELGYRLQRPVWGHGLATEGSRALLDKAFNEWPYEKVCARTLADNLASRRVMEKAGLCFECDFHYDADMLHGWVEQERRAVKYSITRVEYLRSVMPTGKR
ncbi:MAG TPA: GNAT family N-acetyltransferase [Candidatus Acidoferrales bacterium]|jgi:RimJ/RimL family protein N-acetyltransferase|nr:GNAT family N-acetyltransferase [Candidatus Acidoferrales bacterium]